MNKGWFKIAGVQDGDRTIEQQLKGLKPLFPEVADKWVLDLGCAEGLVGMELCAKHGAFWVDGITLVPSEAETGNAVSNARGIDNFVIYAHDLNDVPGLHALGDREDGIEEHYDVILMLAVLHKLREPIRVLHSILAKWAAGLVVIRTAGATPGYICDPRSGNRKFDVVKAMAPDYRLERVESGPFNEWTGYFRKV